MSTVDVRGEPRRRVWIAWGTSSSTADTAEVVAEIARRDVSVIPTLTVANTAFGNPAPRPRPTSVWLASCPTGGWSLSRDPRTSIP